MNQDDFFYKEIDKSGEETLNVIASANNFNKWMFQTIKPFCKGNILEIGSGLGNISNFFIQNNYSIFLSDIRNNYCTHLEQKFQNNKNLLGIDKINLVDKDFDELNKKLINKFDTVFALNVIEHIEDDNLAIINCKKLLKENGNLIILVPAYQILYNHFDKELFHFRRYQKTELTQIFKKNKFTIIKSFYFNALAIIGWFVSGKIAKNKIIPSSQMGFYNKIVFFAKIIDLILFNKIGLSTVVVGRKNKIVK